MRRFDDLDALECFQTLWRFDAFWHFDAFWRSDALMLQYALVLFKDGAMSYYQSASLWLPTNARGQKAWYGPIPLTYPNISCIEEISANKKSHDRKRTGEFFLTPKSGLCWQILTAHIWLTTHRVARGSCNGGQFIRVQREAFRKPDSAQRQVLHPSAAVNNNLHPIELQEVVAHRGLMIFGRFVDFGGIGLLYTGSHINERAMKKSHI